VFFAHTASPDQDGRNPLYIQDEGFAPRTERNSSSIDPPYCTIGRPLPTPTEQVEYYPHYRELKARAHFPPPGAPHPEHKGSTPHQDPSIDLRFSNMQRWLRVGLELPVSKDFASNVRGSSAHPG